MSRNGSGTYSLASGNPVVTGTTISSTTHNNTMTDIATALTDSLAKDGQTVMTGALDHNGLEIILDVDGDTTITADTDDRIDFKIGGVDELTLTAAKADNLDDIAAITPTDSSLLVGDGTNWVLETGATLKTSLGLTIGTDVQAYDADNAVKDVAQEYTATQNFNATTLTSTSNAVAWDASANQVVSHTLTENTTFSAPTNLVDGAFYSLAIIQDSGASGYTVAFNSVFKFIGGTAPTWTTTASARDYISFRSNGANLYEVGHALNVS